MKTFLTTLVAILFATTVQAKDVTLLMDWFPQGNQSVFWQAQFDTKFNADMKIKVKPGGPKINTAAAVAAGQADFGLQ